MAAAGRDEPILDATTKGRVVAMLRKMLLTGIDIGCLAVVVGLHKVVEFLTSWVIPPEWEKLKTFLAVVFAGGFSLIYIHLVVDMVFVFLPWLRGKTKDPVPASTIVKGKAK